MEPTSRRSFAKSLGLVGLLAVGVEGYQEATKIVYRADELPTKELEALLESSESSYIQMQGVYGELKPRDPNSLYYYGMNNYVEGTRKEVWIKLLPGPDGKLYVKENDTWRKI